MIVQVEPGTFFEKEKSEARLGRVLKFLEDAVVVGFPNGDIERHPYKMVKIDQYEREVLLTPGFKEIMDVL